MAYIAGFISDYPVTTAQAPLAGGALDVTVNVLADEWSVWGSGVTLDREAYPGVEMAPAGPLTSFTIQVDSGARVTLSAFTIAPGS